MTRPPVVIGTAPAGVGSPWLIERPATVGDAAADDITPANSQPIGG